MKQMLITLLLIVAILPLASCDPVAPPTPTPIVMTPSPTPSPTPDPRIVELTERLSRLTATVIQTIQQEQNNVQQGINQLTPVVAQQKKDVEINKTPSLLDAAKRNLHESEKKMAKLEGKKEALAALLTEVTANLASPQASPSSR